MSMFEKLMKKCCCCFCQTLNAVFPCGLISSCCVVTLFMCLSGYLSSSFQAVGERGESNRWMRFGIKEQFIQHSFLMKCMLINDVHQILNDPRRAAEFDRLFVISFMLVDRNCNHWSPTVCCVLFMLMIKTTKSNKIFFLSENEHLLPFLSWLQLRWVPISAF